MVTPNDDGVCGAMWRYCMGLEILVLKKGGMTAKKRRKFILEFPLMEVIVWFWKRNKSIFS